MRLSGLLAPESKIYVLLSKVGDTALLNVMWIIFSLPLVTIGAATTALYSVQLKIATGKSVYIFNDFFKSFIQNFVKATVIWLMIIATVGLLVLDFLLINHMEGLMGKLLISPLITLTFCIFVTSIYVFAVLAYFKGSVWQIIKNAFFMALANLPNTFLISICTVSPIAITFLIWDFGFPSFATFFYFIFATSFFAQKNSKILIKIFTKLHVKAIN